MDGLIDRGVLSTAGTRLCRSVIILTTISSTCPPTTSTTTTRTTTTSLCAIATRASLGTLAGTRFLSKKILQTGPCFLHEGFVLRGGGFRGVLGFWKIVRLIVHWRGSRVSLGGNEGFVLRGRGFGGVFGFCEKER